MQSEPFLKHCLTVFGKPFVSAKLIKQWNLQDFDQPFQPLNRSIELFSIFFTLRMCVLCIMGVTPLFNISVKLHNFVCQPRRVVAEILIKINKHIYLRIYDFPNILPHITHCCALFHPMKIQTRGPKWPWSAHLNKFYLKAICHYQTCSLTTI